MVSFSVSLSESRNCGRGTMPYCHVGGPGSAGDNATNIFYRTYGHGSTKVLMIIGLAGTHDSWGPQIRGLVGADVPNDAEPTAANACSSPESNGGIEVCAFDNRGAGRSSVPTKRSEYTTTIMAKDAIALLDHLGWSKAHVFGHSMGGMIACKLAAMAPNRILSLALLNVTGGGFQCFPKLDRLSMSIAVRFLMARTPEERAKVDLDTHYSQEFLAELVGSSTRRSVLYQEYVKGLSASGMQSNHGFEGQVNACWTHKVTHKEIDTIRAAGFLISVIHGRKDVIAQIGHARRLAEKFYPSARMVDLHGGHLVSHERTEGVNEQLLELIKASESNMSPLDWTNLPDKSAGGYMTKWTLISSPNAQAKAGLSYAYTAWEKFSRIFIYIFGIFVLFYEYMGRAVRRVKPVRVSHSLT